MHSAGGRDGHARARLDIVEQVVDLGSRLENLILRYERLVRELAAVGAAPASEMDARVRMVNRDLAAAANQLQQLLLEKRDGLGLVVRRAFDSAAGTLERDDDSYPALPRVASA